MAEKDIDSILQEHRLFPPDSNFSASASIASRSALDVLHKEAKADHVGFWSRLAREHLSWHKKFSRVLNADRAPHFTWFEDGEMNVSVNCLDRHLPEHGQKPAIVFEGEKGDIQRITYAELHQRVCQFASGLKSLGVTLGDRVIIYMPMIPEAVIAMQACARIGAIHSVVFGGFSAESLKDRIEDAGARLLITADGGFRGGKIVELKLAAAKAVAKGCPTIEKVIVFKRTGHPIDWDENKDIWWDAVIHNQPNQCEPTWVKAEHPLFLLYTSGSTGKPKGIQHSSAGYLLNAAVTMQWVFDIKPQDLFWCTADVGWITGHTYVTYGPLANAATILMYEGAPTIPDAGRFWDICARHGVTIFYTAPTAIRALMKFGDDIPEKYDLSRLRLLGTVGEPINPEAWMWYHRVIGKERCPIVDTWWQTETGAHMIAPVPGAVATKPGSCTLPLPGIAAGIVDELGNDVTEPDKGGYLVIKQPWPSMLRTIWGDDARYVATYWSKFGGRYYLAGDSARCDADGYFWIMGRIDDVLNVSGHRLGTMEVESALVAHPRVAEAAVVGRPDPIKGEAIAAFIVLRGSRAVGPEADALIKELRDWVGEQIGAIAKPDDIRIVDNLPKTRSGKIMRRLLRAIARGEEITQDTSTLESEAMIPQLRGEK